MKFSFSRSGFALFALMAGIPMFVIEAAGSMLRIGVVFPLDALLACLTLIAMLCAGRMFRSKRTRVNFRWSRALMKAFLGTTIVIDNSSTVAWIVTPLMSPLVMYNLSSGVVVIGFVQVSVDHSYMTVIPVESAKKETPIQANTRTPIKRRIVLMIAVMTGMIPVNGWIPSPPPRPVDVTAVIVGDIHNFFDGRFNDNNIVFTHNPQMFQ